MPLVLTGDIDRDPDDIFLTLGGSGELESDEPGLAFLMFLFSSPLYEVGSNVKGPNAISTKSKNMRTMVSNLSFILYTSSVTNRKCKHHRSIPAPNENLQSAPAGNRTRDLSVKRRVR